MEALTKMDTKVKLSFLWIFALLNYLYCDIMSLMDSGILKEYLEGTVSGMNITEGFLLGAAVLMEIPILMVLLSRILKHKPNRILNLVAGVIMTLVQAATLFIGTAPMYYIFFSIFEIGATAFIVYTAWKWREPDPTANSSQAIEE